MKVSPTTPDLTSDELDELERLEREATPGTWLADHDFTHDREQTTEYVHLDKSTPGHHALFGTENADIREIHEDHDEDSSVYWDETGRKNMAFVAAVRNAAPRLLALARRTRAAEAELSSLREEMATWHAWATERSAGIGYKPLHSLPIRELLSWQLAALERNLTGEIAEHERHHQVDESLRSELDAFKAAFDNALELIAEWECQWGDEYLAKKWRLKEQRAEIVDSLRAQTDPNRGEKTSG